MSKAKSDICQRFEAAQERFHGTPCPSCGRPLDASGDCPTMIAEKRLPRGWQNVPQGPGATDIPSNFSF